MYIKTFYFLLILVFSGQWAIGENNYRVNRGARPPVDYHILSDTDYEKGVLIVKFHAEYEAHLQDHPTEKGPDGVVRFHMEQLDRLNASYGVKSVRPHFGSPALKNGFTERHKAWGFHLWYRLELDPKAHIPSLADQYQRLREVEIAQPELVKVLIGSHDEADFHKVTKQEIAKKRDWTPNDPQFENQWHYHNTGQQGGTPGADISLPAAWELEKGDTSVIVAVIDGGIDYNHNDLAGNMWYQTGYNFVSDSPVIQPHNHGTHVAGTIAAVNNNNLGVAGVAGGSGNNDGVRLMSCQVFTASSNGGFHIAPVYAADNGAAISQNSWGYTMSGVYEQDVLDAIDYFNENGGGDAMEGGITIFAAGNSNSSSAYYPGYYEGCFSVAATNNQDAKSWYSNYGYWIDISAPGGETNTVTERGVLSTLNNNSYGYYQGTSMACPHVSGVVALMLSSVFGEFTPQDVEDILLNTTDNHYSANPGFTGQLGAGRINAYHAVALSQLYLTLPGNPSNFEAFGISDSEIALSWELNDEQDNVMLAWSPDGSFGIPQEGNSYQPGDQIEGGGNVIYLGDLEEFLHEELNAATLYYYRLWTVDEDLSYSLGRASQTYTQCGITELPLIEGFNNSSDFPYCWSLPMGQGNWRVSSARGNPAPAAEFNWSPSITNYEFALESPPMNGDIPGNAIALEFDLMLDSYNTSTLEEMFVKVFDGEEWIEVMAFDNTQGDMGWDTYFVDITPHALNQNFMVRFVATGANSFNLNYWVIDNFKVYSFSCPQPVNLAIDNITHESALVSWDTGGDEILWHLVWGSPGFDPETGGNLIEDINENQFLLEDLATYTPYQLYVRADCGEDDISLWAGPYNFNTLATCPAPDNLQVSQVTATSANVSWEPVGQENSWDLNWGLSGFNPNTDDNLIEGITETQFALVELEGVTSYDVYVRAYCGEDDLSLWKGPVSFSTICDVFTLPFSETFDGGSVECWSYPEGQGNWGIGSTYPPPSSISGTPHATFSWNPSQVGYSYSLTSPLIDAGNLAGQIKMDFILFVNNYNNNNLNEISVEYKTFEETQWTLLENYTNEGLGSANHEFVVTEMPIPDVQGEMFQVRFRAHGENSFSINGWSVDDIEIYQVITECYAPINLIAENITDQSAQINWTSQGTEQQWHILWGEAGFDPGTEGSIIDNVTEKPVTLEALHPATTYDFYVKAICNEEQQSDWAGPASFTTEPTTQTLYAEAGDHGTIYPQGEITIVQGADHSFLITPNDHYHISEVLLDEQSVMDQLIPDDGSQADAYILHLENIQADHHIVAEFAVNSYTVAADTEPAHGGTVTGQGTYTWGEQVVLWAEPAEDFAFLGWLENGEEISDQQELIFDIEQDRILTAHFQDVTYIHDMKPATVNIYPNPAQDKLWVEFDTPQPETVTISLYSIDGRKVAEKTFVQKGSIKAGFDLKGLHPGVYMIKINDTQFIRKVVVQ